MCAPTAAPFSTTQTVTLAIRRARELREPARRREAGRPRADDDDVELDAFA